MSLSCSRFLTAFALALAAALDVQAADETAKAPLAPTTADRPAPATPTPVVKKKMKLDEPMEGGMMKPGMMKGDMKKAADKKDEEMKQADTKK